MRNYLIVLLVLLANPAYAHNVVGGVYAIGSLIEGEVGFSNGDMAPAGTPVTVSDASGNLLTELKVEEEGMFSFEATQRIDHYFHLELGSGHVLDVVLPADELPDSLTGVDGADSAGGAAVAVSASAATTQVNGANAVELQQMIEQAVAKQVKPLRKELQAYKEKASMQDVLGGMGYIFGLCGIGIWIRQRKLDKKG